MDGSVCVCVEHQQVCMDTEQTNKDVFKVKCPKMKYENPIQMYRFLFFLLIYWDYSYLTKNYYNNYIFKVHEKF